MSDEKNFLMIGLPNAGKTTYLAAFWAIEKDGNTGHKLSCYKYPDDISYLEAIKEKWLNQEQVNRTVSGTPQEVKLPLVENDSGKRMIFNIPDFKGELFQAIIESNETESVKEWVKNSEGFLFFIENTTELPYQEEVGSVTEGDNTPKQLTIENMSPWTKNIVLLKYLSQRKLKDIPLAICFSAWDSIETEMSVEDWVKTEHKFFYNFVKYHFSNVKYFGISAQGREYTKEDSEEIIEQCQKLTEEKKRAFIFTDEKTTDLTEPIDFLINN